MKQNQPIAVPATGPAYAAVTRPADGYKPPFAAAGLRVSAAESHQSRLMEVLKEELFALETERLEGHIAPEEYDRQKAALEIVLKRALQSGNAKSPVESV
jgi:hypothetical protein